MGTKRIIYIIGMAAIIGLAALGCATAPPSTAPAEDGPVPQGALYLLSKSRAETCATCRAEMEKEAFAELSRELVPGKRFSGEFLVKEDEAGKRLVFGQLPSWVSFRFHIRGRRWVGIANPDLSPPALAKRLFSAQNGARFNGSAVLVPYPYGEGPTFVWSGKKGILEIHCRLENMDPQ
ncbi:MAG: hypothetical protein HZB23_05920 [Deltaproteobacteria bacterium]|nr:hypothetical protein [Deltaproteobacteria bacterium]